MRRKQIALGIAFIVSAAFAGEPKTPERASVMDYGPFLTASLLEKKHAKLPTPGDAANPKKVVPPIIAIKGINIRLSSKTSAAVCFDTETLRIGAGWTGGFLNFKDTMMVNHKGTENCTPDGALAFSAHGPGWGKGSDFTDPRPMKVGPLPKEWAHYSGLYVNGDQVVLSYTVGAARVLELPAYETAGTVSAFTRTLNVENAATTLEMLVCDAEGVQGSVLPGGKVAVLEGEKVVAAGIVGDANGASFEIAGGKAIHLKLPPGAGGKFKIAIWNGAKADIPSFEKALKEFSAPIELKTLCNGGPAHWKPLETTGKAAANDAAYVVDTLTMPDNNPWNSWLRTTGIDFFDDGRAAISTLNGDVWIVSGIDATLQKLTWKRFATGLFEPLGLKIVGGDIYVTGRDQITRLRDLNNDDEADFYENFFNGCVAHHAYHCFAMDLQTDSQGNFYYARCGLSASNGYPDHGCLYKISHDGSKCEVVLTGLRVANGFTIGPNDQIVIGDNQGEWTPSSKISFPKPGDFLGYMIHHHFASPPTDFVKPLCWIPYKIDNSCGGEEWARGDKWGPLNNHYIHTSFGKSILMAVMVDEIGGKKQGGSYVLPLQFATGIMRARMNPKDGQLYLCGVGGGWQTNGVRDGSLQRVRFTGKPANLPVEMRVGTDSIAIIFSDPLDIASAQDPQNYDIEQWIYKWTAKYGSDEFSAANPEKKEHDPVAIKSVKMIDEHTVLLEIPGLKPVMQMQIAFKLKAADGSTIKQTIWNTIHVVPK